VIRSVVAVVVLALAGAEDSIFDEQDIIRDRAVVIPFRRKF
jgi:hypothetical protein